MGWANASWHIENDDDAYAVAISHENEYPFVDEIVRGLVASPRNRNLALRPPNVTDEEAANILYFGHVIEDVYTRARIQGNQLIWTPFYETMGLVANDDNHLFAADAIRIFPVADHSFFHNVVKRYDSYKPDDMAALPNLTQLEQAIDKACEYLISKSNGDARELGRGWTRYSYHAALRETRKADFAEEICRQFAKLAIVWGIWPQCSKPRVFELAFSQGIVMLFWERNYLITDAQRLRTDDQRLMYCFEDSHRHLLLMSYDTIERTRDPAIVSWRNAEKDQAAEMGLDWCTAPGSASGR